MVEYFVDRVAERKTVGQTPDFVVRSEKIGFGLVRRGMTQFEPYVCAGHERDLAFRRRAAKKHRNVTRVLMLCERFFLKRNVMAARGTGDNITQHVAVAET